MTIQELIDSFQKLPPKMQVIFDDTEYGHQSIFGIEVIEVINNLGIAEQVAYLFGDNAYDT